MPIAFEKIALSADTQRRGTPARREYPPDFQSRAFSSFPCLRSSQIGFDFVRVEIRLCLASELGTAHVGIPHGDYLTKHDVRGSHARQIMPIASPRRQKDEHGAFATLVDSSEVDLVRHPPRPSNLKLIPNSCAAPTNVRASYVQACVLPTFIIFMLCQGRVPRLSATSPR